MGKHEAPPLLSAGQPSRKPEEVPCPTSPTPDPYTDTDMCTCVHRQDTHTQPPPRRVGDKLDQRSFTAYSDWAQGMGVLGSTVRPCTC